MTILTFFSLLFYYLSLFLYDDIGRGRLNMQLNKSDDDDDDDEEGDSEEEQGEEEEQEEEEGQEEEEHEDDEETGGVTEREVSAGRRIFFPR